MKAKTNGHSSSAPASIVRVIAGSPCSMLHCTCFDPGINPGAGAPTIGTVASGKRDRVKLVDTK
ncbi:hypothetical protein RHA1_ro05433 [Rhodococcus jostii RHA1]|uniref:Uncharacterized protein n=1 Tax=Rhodococcus jostii (strain RHA1) TaxID=101510 RepID=Q0S5H3_RHOJR|nr:hypothetical protein RHA1_ro05433 [Rhodococcus jostii RHA1]